MAKRDGDGLVNKPYFARNPMAKSNRKASPMTPAEARLVEAAIRWKRLSGSYFTETSPELPIALEAFGKAVKAVVRERSRK